MRVRARETCGQRVAVRTRIPMHVCMCVRKLARASVRGRGRGGMGVAMEWLRAGMLACLRVWVFGFALRACACAFALALAFGFAAASCSCLCACASGAILLVLVFVCLCVCVSASVCVCVVVRQGFESRVPAQTTGFPHSLALRSMLV